MERKMNTTNNTDNTRNQTWYQSALAALDRLLEPVVSILAVIAEYDNPRLLFSEAEEVDDEQTAWGMLQSGLGNMEPGGLGGELVSRQNHS